MPTSFRRKFLFASLYFSEGAPIGFLWWALPTRLRASGLEVGDITSLLGILVLPWAFKFLGAPFIDIVRSRRWPLRAWIASCQVLMGVFLLPTLLLDWRADFALIATLLILHAVAAATQDVAVDAYALAVVPVEQRGSINAWMQAGMLIGRSIFGGGALLLDARIGPAATIVLLVTAIWSSLAVLVLAGEPEPARPPGTIAARGRAFLAVLRDVLRRRTTWLVLAFAAIGGAGFESVGLLVGPYLLDRGFSSEQIGGFLFLPTVAAMILGALVAGRRADRYDRRREAGLALVLMAATILALAAFDARAPWVTLALLALLLFHWRVHDRVVCALHGHDRSPPGRHATERLHVGDQPLRIGIGVRGRRAGHLARLRPGLFRDGDGVARRAPGAVAAAAQRRWGR